MNSDDEKIQSLPRPNVCTYWVTPQLLAGEYPTHSSGQEDETRQKLRDYLNCGITHFIDLTQEGENPNYKDMLQDEATALGSSTYYTGSSATPKVVHQRFAIPDFGIPSKENMACVLDAIDTALSSSNGKVYVHCRGGIGRTGTAVGCFLSRRRGYTGEAALKELNLLFRVSSRSNGGHQMAPETPDQRKFVREW
jgi:protein-tyrosine phosphatase